MSLKAELETWAAALKAYDGNDYDLAIEYFEKIADTSKVFWNIGIILATLGRHDEAVKRFEEATRLDVYFTIAYHQKGVSNFMLGRYDAAYRDFENALLYLRGNQTIYYEQLGLDFRLYSAEVLFNCGLSRIYMGQTAAGLADLKEAATQKQVPEHSVIDDAIRDQGRDYNVFSVPVGAVFRPSPVKLKNLAARDYMGKAILVAATDANEAYTTFTGITRLQRGQTPTGAPLDPSHPLAHPASVRDVPAPSRSFFAARFSRSHSISSMPTSPRPGATQSPVQSLSRAPRPSPVPTSTAPKQKSPPASLSAARPALTVHTDVSASGYGDNASLAPRNDLQNTPIHQSPLLFTPESRANAIRVTELYDEYYNGTTDEPLPRVPSTRGREAGTVARTGPLGRSLSRNAPPSSFAGNKGWGGSDGKNGTLLERSRSMLESRDSRYDEEDVFGFAPMTKIRIKVHVGNLTRGMSVLPDQSFEQFITALRAKFPELGSNMGVRFKDEDGDMLSMQDEGDFEAAVDVARVTAQGKTDGKLEIWVD